VQVTKLDPKLAIAHYNLGNALKAARKIDEAVASYRRAIDLDPRDFQSHFNLGSLLVEQGQAEQAIECFSRVTALRPEEAAPQRNLAILLDAVGRVDEAIDAGHRALSLGGGGGDPALVATMVDLHVRRGLTLYDAATPDRAVPEFNKAIALQPDNAKAHYCLAMALLCQGDFDKGWREFEWRWRIESPDIASVSTFRAPRRYGTVSRCRAAQSCCGASRDMGTTCSSSATPGRSPMPARGSRSACR
jgi:tetratricopeptide (TPR) repeat protein